MGLTRTLTNDSYVGRGCCIALLPGGFRGLDVFRRHRDLHVIIIHENYPRHDFSVFVVFNVCLMHVDACYFRTFVTVLSRNDDSRRFRIFSALGWGEIR
jgi:hypothetical protein